MASKKRDLEIIFNLVWKNSLSGEEPSIVVGIYDIPSTTLVWEKFKAYMLKNAGTSTEHVKVSYFDCSGKELPIECQNDFQLALYCFRKRAHNGDISILKFEKINPKISLTKRRILKPREETVERMKEFCPPDWFVRYMRRFKKEMVEEVGTMIKANSSRKSKSETSKNPDSLDFNNIKKLKSEKRMFDNKMDYFNKMEHYKFCNTFKMKAMNDALNASDFISTAPPIDETEFMNASMVDAGFPSIHLMGGETYMHNWKVVNSGMLAWNKNTVIQFSWGSQNLIPMDLMIECPHLKPGEIGNITTSYRVPVIPGSYECYWHFHHKGNRFGKWLGLQVIVDDIKKAKRDIKVESALEIDPTEELALERMMDLQSNEEAMANSAKPISGLSISVCSDVDKPEIGDADSISIISLNGSNSSKDGYVMVYGNENCEQENGQKENAEQENAQAIKEDEKSEQQGSDNRSNDEINVAEDVVTDYAFIYYNGEKYPLHKRYLKEDYFLQAEAKPAEEKPAECIKTENVTIEIPPEEVNNQGGLSNEPTIQSMLSSCENRLFIFPQQSPGFEVVQTTAQELQLEEATNSTSIKLDEASALREDPQNVEFHSVDEYEDQNKNIASAPINSSFNMSVSDSTSNRSCSHHPHDSPRCCFKERSMSEGHQSMDCDGEYSSYSSRTPNNVPDNLLTGAALLASSAMSTARNMMDMVMQNGKWVNGHWVSENPNGKRESALAALSEMGFNNRDLNATLLARYNDDVCKVVSELIE